MADALRVAGCIRDRDACALRDTEQRELLRSDPVDDRLQVAEPTLELEPVRVDLAIGEPAAALVVADDRAELAQPGQPMTPDRTLPVMLDVREPVRRLDERRSGS
jgi:hypothetical protein